MACAGIKFITFRVKLRICDSLKSITFPKEKQRFLHFGHYRGVKKHVGDFGRREKTRRPKSPTCFVFRKCLIFLRKNKVFLIVQTSLRTFALSANVLKDVCTILQFVQTSLRTFAHFHCKNKGFLSGFWRASFQLDSWMRKNAHTLFISPPTSAFRLHFQRNVQTSLRTFAQLIFKTTYCVFANLSAFFRRVVS